MKKIVFVVLLMPILSPAWSQTRPLPKDLPKRVDNCAPIGRTADGKLVYSMKCETLPIPPASAMAPQSSTPPASSPQADVRPEPEPEPRGGGLFGLSYDRR